MFFNKYFIFNLLLYYSFAIHAETDILDDVRVKKEVHGDKGALTAQYKQKLVNNILLKNKNTIDNKKNIIVYLTSLNIPLDKLKQEKLKSTIESVTSAYINELLLSSISLTKEKGDTTIEQDSIVGSAQLLSPFKINKYKDIIFFPNLKQQQILIEDSDIALLSKSGIQWEFFLNSLASEKLIVYFDVNQAAISEIANTICQFSVLLLRVASELAIKADETQLKAAHIQQAYDKINLLASLNRKNNSSSNQPLASSDLLIQTEKYFTDITDKAGINSMHRTSRYLNQIVHNTILNNTQADNFIIPPAFSGSGVAAEDINNDSFIDLLILGGQANQLLLNNGKGKFFNITEQSGIGTKKADNSNFGEQQQGEPRQALINDFDNDGWQDIVITYVNENVHIYKNLGNGQFKDMSSIANLGGKKGVAGPATVIDYNNDGLLDIYIGYFGDYTKGELPESERTNQSARANKLFKNLGNFKFQDITSSAGVGDTGWAQTITHTDINGDSWQDLLVGNDFGNDNIFINKKDGTFADYADQLGIGNNYYNRSISVADLNRDQLPDIIISSISNNNTDKNRQESGNSKLLLTTINQQGKITYQQSDTIKYNQQLPNSGNTWDADFFDADLDGDDDLYVLKGVDKYLKFNSKPILNSAQYKSSNVFFLNHGGKLKDISTQSGLDFPLNSRSAAYLDYDNDGDIDIIVNNFHAKAVMLQNNARQRLKNSWIKIRALGDPEQGVSRDAIGTKILVTTNQKHQIWREVHSTTGYLSVHPKIQHFGLGKSKKANIRIVWPNSKIQTINDIPVNKSYVIDQKTNSVSLY